MSNGEGNTKGPAGTAADLKKLLEHMRATGTDDGSIELAMAIASVTSKVTVALNPLRVEPDDLFELTFNDPTVGISNAQMADVKANLTFLLPEIADDIARIPEDASNEIEDVQEFIRLALLKSSRGGQ
jgi:hypothetical protein